MSMFNRAVKLQFNRMKYADLKSTTAHSQRFSVDFMEVIYSRAMLTVLGFVCCAGLMNFDINLFFPHEHKHEHGLIGDFPGSHGHGHGHDGGHDDHHSHHSAEKNPSHGGHE